MYAADVCMAQGKIGCLTDCAQGYVALNPLLLCRLLFVLVANIVEFNLQTTRLVGKIFRPLLLEVHRLMRNTYPPSPPSLLGRSLKLRFGRVSRERR